MKDLIIILCLLFFVSVSHAQKDYSHENLQKLSQEELDVYLNKALKLQKSGKTYTIVGVSALGAVALSIPLDSSGGMVAATAAIFVGIPALAATTVGISKNSKGKKRVERINSIENTASNDIIFVLKPFTQYNLMTQNHQPGITPRIRF